jgi:hypothetical protein
LRNLLLLPLHPPLLQPLLFLLLLLPLCPLLLLPLLHLLLMLPLLVA